MLQLDSLKQGIKKEETLLNRKCESRIEEEAVEYYYDNLICVLNQVSQKSKT